MSGKILVTGATGKVGSELVKNLVAKGEVVRAGIHYPDRIKEEDWKEVEIVQFNFIDLASVKKAFEGVDRLFLLTPPESTEELENGLLDLARKSGIRHIAKLSAAGVESNENDPLRMAEKRVEASGIPYTFIRPGWFAQNFSASLADDIRSGVLALPAGTASIAFIDTRDVAAVAATVLTEPGHENKAYFITGGELISYYQVAEYISKAIDREVKYIPITDEVFRSSISSFMPSRMVELLSNLYAAMREGYMSYSSPTIAELLGRPPIRFEQFAQDYAQVWK